LRFAIVVLGRHQCGGCRLALANFTSFTGRAFAAVALAVATTATTAAATGFTLTTFSIADGRWGLTFSARSRRLGAFARD